MVSAGDYTSTIVDPAIKMILFCIESLCDVQIAVPPHRAVGEQRYYGFAQFGRSPRKSRRSNENLTESTQIGRVVFTLNQFAI